MRILLITLISTALNQTIFASEWNQWRGPSRDGVINREAPFPKQLQPENLKSKWTAELAEGYSSPIVANGKVFTFETENQTHEIARAFDLTTGKQLWEKKWQGAIKVPFFAAKNGSWVRCTPATDGKYVYFGGMRDVLVKLDAETGDEIWRIDFVEREGTQLPTFGYISSPLLEGDHIYVQAGSAVTKINAETGENVWRLLEDVRAMFGNAFSSPILADICGSKQLLIQNRMSLAGLDPVDGKTLWSIPVKAFRGMNILTPTVLNDLIFTATYGGGAFCFKVTKEDDQHKVTTQWQDEKLEGYMSSPLLIDDHLFLHGRDQKFHCVNFTDGTRKWSSEEKFGAYWSLVRNNNRTLALDETGELILFDASPDKFEILDRRKISDQPTYAHIGITDDLLLVRSLRGLEAFQWSTAE